MVKTFPVKFRARLAAGCGEADEGVQQIGGAGGRSMYSRTLPAWR